MSALNYYLDLPLARKNKTLLRFWSDCETFVLGKKIECDIRDPIFVCGLARSGTTLVTHILHLHPHTGSFQYCDVPFIEIPYLWSFVSGLYYGKRKPQQRLHRDNIKVDPHSPDAFEELIWKNHIQEYENEGFSAVITEAYSQPELEKQLSLVMKKVLFVRGKKQRYLSKGNYNLFRLPYILKLFPDAKIIICVRDPFEQAQSLARVHRTFMDIAQRDTHFAKQLSILGHYEFGPQRKAIRLNETNYQKTIAHWEKGEDYLGYLLQWKDVYNFAYDNYWDHENILWLDNSNLIEQKSLMVHNLLQFNDLPEEDFDTDKAMNLIKDKTSYPIEETPYDTELKNLYDRLDLKQ